MNPEAAFLRAIADNAEEDLPRLLYADWLEEQGDQDQQLRAEFIRVQCALERTPSNNDQYRAMQHREQELFRQIWPLLVRPLLEAFQLRETDFRHPERAKGNFLTQWLGFSTGAQLVYSAHARGETKLNLVANTTDETAFRYPHSIASVDIRRGLIDDLCVRASNPPDPAAWSSFFERYDLHGLTLMEGDWFEIWSQLPIIPRLKKLSFIYERPHGTSDAVMNLFNFTDPLQLTELELYQTPFDRESLQQFFDSWLLRQLQILRWTALDPEEVLVFSHQQSLMNLQTLDLSYSCCHSLGIGYLARSQVFENLRNLDLSHCSIGDTGGRALARSENFPNLRQLHLQGNRLSEYSVRNLAIATGFGSLELLNLAGNPALNESGVYALAQTKTLTSLEQVIVDERFRETDAGRALQERFEEGVVFEER